MGLLTSDQVPAGRTVYYGMIADGIHTNPAALRIAHRAHASGGRSSVSVSGSRVTCGSVFEAAMLLPLTGLVLVTDAITAMGLPPGRHSLGQQIIEIQGLHAYVAGLFHRKNTFYFH